MFGKTVSTSKPVGDDRPKAAGFMMRVAFDAQSAHGKKSGLGVYVSALMEALRVSLPAGVEIDFFPDSSSGFCGNLTTPRRLHWEVLGFPGHVHSGRYDLAHIPAFAMGWPQAKTVLTVHDLIGMTFPNQAGVASKFYWGQWLPWAAKRADHIIADSLSTQNDLMRLLRVPEHKISLVYPSGHEAYQGSVSPEVLKALRSRISLHSDYFLCVGTLEPRKNLKRVIEAFRRMSQRHQSKPLSLVLVGAKDFAQGQFYKALFGKEGAMPNNIIFPGYLKNEELHALYSGAEALIFPSLYEGFGLPVLEAMAAGCPVITSKTTSLPEVGGEAALYVDPKSVESIADAIEIIYIDRVKRGEFIRAGHLRTSLFSWRKTALQTIEVYKKVIHGG